MYSGSERALLALLMALLAAACGRATPTPAAAMEEVPEPAVLRVCADPNNLPFSNERREGFENELAALVAGELGWGLEYTWWPQRRGSTRLTLNAGVCDVIIGVPEDYELARTTRPYYASTYVFVTRADGGVRVTSFDDPRLRRMTIGIHVVGDDYANVPPGDALVARGITSHIRGFSVLGDYAQPNPPARLIEAVGAGDVDVAIAWGPLAAYFAKRAGAPLRIAIADPVPEIPMRFAISMAVRRTDTDLAERLNGVIERRRTDIDALLDRFDVPRIDREAQVAAR